MLTAFRISPTLPVICAGYPLSWLLGDIGILIHYKRLPVFRKKQSGI
ncbi:MAG: hypothetical protein IJM69_03855 [Firmicutes bacterium]|nr:hypothetical protein [Bacillota bacterium]